MNNSISYLKGIWSSRYFWWHLMCSDLRIKYRRSFLGLSWAFIQPFMMTLLLSFVMSHLFHSPMKDYAPFVFSGLIFWEFIVLSIVTGCGAFTNAGPYINQFSHPLIIYSLRSVLVCMINLLCAFIGLVVWVVFWKPANISFSWISLLTSFPLLFLFVWPISTISAFIGLYFRDFSQLIIIIMQALYYISPIFFLPSLFYNAKMDFLIDYNPITHLLNLFRKPLLEGVIPSSFDFIFILCAMIFLWLCAGFLIHRNEKNIVFYL